MIHVLIKLFIYYLGIILVINNNQYYLRNSDSFIFTSNCLQMSTRRCVVQSEVRSLIQCQEALLVISIRVAATYFI